MQAAATPKYSREEMVLEDDQPAHLPGGFGPSVGGGGGGGGGEPRALQLEEEEEDSGAYVHPMPQSRVSSSRPLRTPLPRGGVVVGPIVHVAAEEDEPQGGGQGGLWVGDEGHEGDEHEQGGAEILMHVTSRKMLSSRAMSWYVSFLPSSSSFLLCLSLCSLSLSVFPSLTKTHTQTHTLTQTDRHRQIHMHTHTLCTTNKHRYSLFSLASASFYAHNLLTRASLPKKTTLGRQD
jgi:hypothetical protein